MADSISKYFQDLPDPRSDRGKRHVLTDMLLLTVCAVICGADGWVEVEDFGRAKAGWLRLFLKLPHGVPSHDTLGRVFARLDPAALEICLMSWFKHLAQIHRGQLIAIDGKTLRHSFDTASKKAAIHMVSAWCEANHLVLGQLATDAKSNEITAIPKLLELLDLTDAVVTIDAMGCQQAIAGQIIDQGGDYVLGLKGNQGTLHQRVRRVFDEALTDGWAGVRHGCHETVEKDHGRIETRRVWCTDQIDGIRQHHPWSGLRTVACVESQRTVGDQTSTERRYYISSLNATHPRRIAEAIRGHWGIENSLHWSLDVTFREDDCRIRQGHGAEHLARFRRIAVSLLKREKTFKAGLKRKRLRCALDPDYLTRVIAL